LPKEQIVVVAVRSFLRSMVFSRKHTHIERKEEKLINH